MVAPVFDNPFYRQLRLFRLLNAFFDHHRRQSMTIEELADLGSLLPMLEDCRDGWWPTVAGQPLSCDQWYMVLLETEDTSEDRLEFLAMADPPDEAAVTHLPAEAIEVMSERVTALRGLFHPKDSRPYAKRPRDPEDDDISYEPERHGSEFRHSSPQGRTRQ